MAETRTQEEIVARIEEVSKDDFFGAKRTDLLQFLSYENAKSSLKEEVTAEDWSKNQKECTKENIVAEIKNYMPFAWDKANDKRGISAGRSQDHMEAWLWLLNDPELYEKWESTEYNYYGKEKLNVICKALEIESLDDNVRENS